MPLQINTLSPSTPFLQSYVPYRTPENTTVADGIEDMISYNFVLNDSPTKLSYLVGAEGSYQDTFVIKNITTNITLDLVVRVNSDIFIIKNLDQLSFSLTPNETKSFSFELNKGYLDSLTTKLKLETYIDVVVTSRQNGSVVLIDSNTDRIPAQRIPATLDIV